MVISLEVVFDLIPIPDVNVEGVRQKNEMSPVAAVQVFGPPGSHSLGQGQISVHDQI